MTREDLVAEARSLNVLSPGAYDEFSEQREELVAAFNTAFAARSDLDTLIGPGNEDMMRDNHRNHARFMQSVFQNPNPEVLVDTVLWVFRAYRSHGFQLTYWPAQLDSWIELFRENLSADTFREIEPYYTWMLRRQPYFTALSDTALSSGHSQHS